MTLLLLDEESTLFLGTIFVVLIELKLLFVIMVIALPPDISDLRFLFLESVNDSLLNFPFPVPDTGKLGVKLLLKQHPVEFADKILSQSLVFDSIFVDTIW